jgi:DNA-binding NtrC family response regulator
MPIAAITGMSKRRFPEAMPTELVREPAAGELRVDRYELAVVEGPSTGIRLVGSDSPVTTIGSHELCSLVLADPLVSRFHCEIRLGDDGPRLRDTGSLNGTTIDGVRVVESYLRGGSILRLGKSAVRFEFAPNGHTLLSSARRFGQLVGESVAMRQVFAYLERAAPTSATVLLEGETGTGKSLAARAIHENSPRRDQSFVIVDCAAIPAGLLESELFGHERGAFTGAEARRIGAFEEASGGTLFLDEIGELPADLQSKLLGAIENRAVRRLGGNGAIPFDIRLVAATNRDLRADLNSGRFRADLFFRLAVVRIELPSLRRRHEDVPLLAAEILTGLGASPDRARAILDADTARRLSSSAWPGNIRELRNYLERRLVLDDGHPPDGDQGRAIDPPFIDPGLAFADARTRALAHFERRYCVALLERHEGRVAQAAAAAGIDRTYFYRLLRRHGLPMR